MKKTLEHLCKKDNGLFVSTFVNKESKTIERVMLSGNAYHKGDFEKPFDVLNQNELDGFCFGSRTFCVLLFGKIDVHVVEIKKMNEIADIVSFYELPLSDLRIINITGE